MKKKSARRSTPSEVLPKDEFEICSIWLVKLLNECNSIIVIRKTVLRTLLHGIGEYVTGKENEKHLEAYDDNLKE